MDVTNEGTDTAGPSRPTREQVERRTGQEVEQRLPDGGYFTQGDLERAHADGVELFVPPKPARAEANQGRELEPERGDAEATPRRRSRGSGGRPATRGRPSTGSGRRPAGHSVTSSQGEVRLNLQLEVDSFTPLDCDVSGRADASEPAAFARRLHPGVVYVADRNFFSYRFVNAVLDCGSNPVLRVRKNAASDVDRPLPPAAADADAEAEAGVTGDDLVRFRGATDPGNRDHRSFTDRPPDRLMRRVVVWDERNKVPVVIVTDLIDLPARVVAALYRHRWQVGLFFKWLKTHADLDHLLSHNHNGVTFQFYVAVTATLLLHLATGRRPGRYALFWLGCVANGAATFEEMAAGLARTEREAELARARRRRLAARKKLPA